MRHPLRAAALAAFAFAAVKLSGCETPTVTQSLTVGSPCAQASDCGSAPPFACGNLDRGGYCTKDCKTDMDCPGESICAFRGGTVGQCALKCDSTANCRFSSGYVCRPASNDVATLASHGYCGLSDSAAPDLGGSADMAVGGPDGGGSDGGGAVDMTMTARDLASRG